jgi:hypothetical protein
LSNFKAKYTVQSVVVEKIFLDKMKFAVVLLLCIASALALPQRFQNQKRQVDDSQNAQILTYEVCLLNKVNGFLQIIDMKNKKKVF